MPSPTVILAVSPRTVSRKAAAKLRVGGSVPGVVYGRGFPTESIQCKQADLSRIAGKALSSTILTLVSDQESYQVLMHDWAKNPVTDRYLHVDFLRIRADEEIDADVPIVFTGESPVVKEHGGVLVTNMDSLAVRCLPADLPANISVHLSTITEFGRPIHVSDITAPERVRIMSAPESAIVSVTHIKAEEEVASTETVPESAKEPVVEPTEGNGEKEKKE